MKGKRCDPDVEASARAAIAAGKSLRAVAAEFGISAATAHRIKSSDGCMPDVTSGPGMTFDAAGDRATIRGVTDQLVRSEDDLIRVCRIDTTRWRIVRMRVSAYQGAMKLERREPGADGRVRILDSSPHTTQLFSISADLALILPRPYLEATEALWERLARSAPKYPAPPRSSSPYLCTLGLFDVHFAKLCWGRETGAEDYDLRIAESVYREAADDLLARLAPYRIGRFVLPLGNDFFHVDSPKNATTAGTVVDCDSRYPKMIEIGSAAIIRMVERLQELAPVDIFYVPGNHDRISSYHLCREVAAWFRRAPGIAVDTSPNVRKYRRYGRCLFGFRHGDLLADSQVSTLPGLMAAEAAEDWGRTECREWFVGHRHTSRRFVSRASDEIQGVQVRYLPSLSGTDAWHHENGFVGNRRAAEAYLHETEGGFVGYFVSAARRAG